jgi:hypothetical protein
MLCGLEEGSTDVISGFTRAAHHSPIYVEDSVGKPEKYLKNQQTTKGLS